MRKNHKKINVLVIVLIILAVIGVIAVMAWPKQPQQAETLPATEGTGPVETTEATEPSELPSVTDLEETTVPATSTESAATDPGATQPTQAAVEVPDAQIQPQEQMVINLGSGLELTDSGKYTGLYMEDGSNKVVSNVMMIVVRNNGQQDIQWAAFTAVSGAETYRFQLTNLAAGEQVVLLDLDQKKADGYLTSAAMDQIVLFSEPMSLYENTIQISGMNGMLNVKNISDTDIAGDVYIYYKYAAQDLYYGGVTFRVRVEGGLKAGEIRQVLAQHYTEKGCAFVQVTIHE